MDGLYQDMIQCEKEKIDLPDTSEILEKAETVCPVDWALAVADKARRESCGKCVMCREGTLQLYTIISDIVSGKGESDDPDLILDLCGVIGEAADCEMAREASSLIRLSLETHRDDWNAHILRKRCPALVCSAYITIAVKPDLCKGSGECAKVCPENAIAGSEGLIHVVDAALCTRCGACIEACPHGAVGKFGVVVPKTPDKPVPVGSFEGAPAGRRRRRG